MAAMIKPEFTELLTKFLDARAEYQRIDHTYPEYGPTAMRAFERLTAAADELNAFVREIRVIPPKRAKGRK